MQNWIVRYRTLIDLFQKYSFANQMLFHLKIVRKELSSSRKII